MRLPTCIISVCAAVFAPVAVADSACQKRARTDYEKLYCTIQDQGGGAGLPRFEDFQRNNERIQATLLKRPAQKLGLALPKPRKREMAPAPKAKPATAKTQPPARPAVTAPDKRQATPSRPNNSLELANCRLQGESLRCGSDDFWLATNLPNSSLAADALSDSNTFGLKNFQGNVKDEEALRRYLSASYRHYIDKMLAIGLGDATMSYTKFHYTFLELAKKQENFAVRFETTYRYLKRDKASMAIKPRYQSRLPNSIDQCQVLSDRIIVCDDKTLNWVYVKN